MPVLVARCRQDAEEDEVSGDEEEVADSDESGDASPKEGEEGEAESAPKGKSAKTGKKEKIKPEKKGSCTAREHSIRNSAESGSHSSLLDSLAVHA